MKKLLVALLPLAGCATVPSPQEAAAMAQRTTTVDLCYYAVAGSAWQRQASTNELARRQSTCQAEMPMVMARLQNDHARKAAFMQWQAQQQQANQAVWQQNMNTMFPNRQTTCTSQQIGTQIETVCK